MTRAADGPSRPGCPVLLGAGQRVGSGRAERVARFIALRQSTPSPHHGRLPDHDGGAGEAPGRERDVASAERPAGILAGDILLCDVHICHF